MAAVAASFSVAAASCVGPAGYGPGTGWHLMNYGFGGVVMWLLILAVVAFIVYMLVLGRNKAAGPADRETPLDVLKRRYAAGEITKDQYEQMRQDIEV